jgi:hypothetical protein
MTQFHYIRNRINSIIKDNSNQMSLFIKSMLLSDSFELFVLPIPYGYIVCMRLVDNWFK